MIPARPRLAALARLVLPGLPAADVGTDHALLPRALLREGRVPRCVATEASEAQLERTRRAVAGDPCGPRLELRAGPGLAPLRPDDGLGTVVLAGMGGRTIVRILDDPRRAALGIRRLVLQPATDAAGVRAWLRRAGLGIVAEELAEDAGRPALVLAAEPGASEPPPPGGLEPEDLLDAGPILVRSADPGVRRFWEGEAHRLEAIVASGAGGPAGARAARRLARVARILATLPTEAPDR